ncbi:MAG: hypothetical protein KIT24_11615 [Phycisphaeraceae bacterium]|nr:hypothetical protein [Phycisphaeraceae bacterium]
MKFTSQTWRFLRTRAAFDSLCSAASALEATAQYFHQKILQGPSPDTNERYLPPTTMLERANGSPVLKNARLELETRTGVSGGQGDPVLKSPNDWWWVERADWYWKHVEIARDKIEVAKEAVRGASEEIDGSETRPLERSSHRILESLNAALMATRTSVQFGWNPFCYPQSVCENLLRIAQEIDVWIERLRPLAEERGAVVEPVEPAAVTPPTAAESLGLRNPPHSVAAAMDPSVIDLAAERAAQKIARVVGSGDDNGHAKPPALPAGADESAGPALTANQSRVLQTMALFDPSLLLSSKMIAAETEDRQAIPPLPALSDETVRQCVVKLIESNLAERPEGDRSGARLTMAGRKLAGKIAD